MARGWESKSVEDQVSSAEAEKSARPTGVFQRDREKQAQREALLLSKAHLLNRLEVARNERYRAQLQLALEHLEGKLRELDESA